MKRERVEYKTALQLVCNQPKEYIDEYAQTSAKRLGLIPGGDILSVTLKLGGRLHYRSVFDDEATDTIYVHGQGDFDIVLPDHSTPRRDRFTIAHELGHYLLHSWIGKRPLVANRNGSDRAEWEANWFAAGFIMPEDEFKKAHAQKRSLSWLADHFDVSEHAAQVRCKVLGLSA